MKLKKNTNPKFEPVKFRNIFLQPVDNKPKYKKGDKVIYFDGKSGKYAETTLEKVKKERVRPESQMRGCVSCKRPRSTETVNAWKFTWNGDINERAIQQNVVELLNDYTSRLSKAQSELSERNEKAERYEKAVNALKGIDEDDW